MTDSTGSPLIPDGWLPDPSSPERERWWTAGAWTNTTRPLPNPHPASLPNGVPIVEQPGTGMTKPAWVLFVLSFVTTTVVAAALVLAPPVGLLLLLVTWIALGVLAAADRKILKEQHIKISAFTLSTVILGPWGYLTSRAIQMKQARGSFAAIAAATAFIAQLILGNLAAGFATGIHEVVSRSQLETSIQQQLATEGVTATVQCPRSPNPDEAQDCTVTTDQGRILTVTFTIDENGNIHVAVKGLT